MDVPTLHLRFDGELWFWRGPSPFHFITVPDDGCDAIRAIAPEVSYGWGVIPVRASIGRSDFTTALFPKDGRYLVPVKDAVRAAEGLGLGDRVTVELYVGA